jgi:hypothetical protein
MEEAAENDEFFRAPKTWVPRGMRSFLWIRARGLLETT